MLNKTPFKPFLVAALVLGSVSVQAHRAWIVPQETVLSGENRWVSFDAAVSNDIFLANYNPGRFADVQVINPDGSKGQVENLHTGKYRSVFDLALKQEGTYRLFIASSGLRALWEEDGQRRMYPGRGEQYSAEGFAKAVPENAEKLVVSQASRRMETFVTLGAPSRNALAVSGQGLELVAVTHPNDLFAGEEASFRFLIDGEAAEGADVTLIREGTRYRNAQEAITLKTNSKGEITVRWNGAGRYFLEAEYKDNKAQKPATERSGSYVAVLEVLPD